LAADLELPWEGCLVEPHRDGCVSDSPRLRGGSAASCGSVLAENVYSVDMADVATVHLGDSFSGGSRVGDLSHLRRVPAE
jgi:hypothetical protein